MLPLQFDRTPPGQCRDWAWAVLCTSALLAFASPAWSQTTSTTYFPAGNTGYDQDLGVTVLSRVRTGYQERGVRIGGFIIRPELDQSIFDNSNVNGTSGGGSGSWGSDTAGSIEGESDWNRNSLNGSVGFDHNQFFALPNENYTNWNVGIGGGYTIGDSQLLATYAHSSFNQLGTTIGMQRSAAPSLDTTDTGELGYTFNFGRFAVTPTLDASAYRFGDITSGGTQASQSYLDRNVIAGGVVTRYALTGGTGLLFVARGTGSDYINPQAGQPSNNSTSALVLAGIDYQAESLWRYSLLVGVEHTDFAAGQYGTYTAPIVSADVVYSPTGGADRHRNRDAQHSRHRHHSQRWFCSQRSQPHHRLRIASQCPAGRSWWLPVRQLHSGRHTEQRDGGGWRDMAAQRGCPAVCERRFH